MEIKYGYKTIQKSIGIPSIDINKVIKKKIILNNNLKTNISKGKKILRKSEPTIYFNREYFTINDKKGNKSESCELLDSLNNIDRNSVEQNRTISEKKRINNNSNKSDENDNSIITNYHKIVNFNFNNKDKKISKKRNTTIIRIKKKNLKSKTSLIYNNIYTKKEIENMKYKKLETLFNKAVNLGFKSNKIKKDLEAYASSTGKKINKMLN
jgi:hypothetical protein